MTLPTRTWAPTAAAGLRTPAFDRIAREGLLFHRAYTPNAKCAPSRACILTGRNSWQLKEACNHFPFFPPEFKTYVEALADAGYHVGKTAKGWAPGVARDRDGKPRNLAGKAFNTLKAKPPARGVSNIDYAGNFADFLDQRPDGRPFCFWYGGLEPHRAYEFGAGVAKGGKSTSDIDRVPEFWPDNETVRNDLLDYAFEIEHFDRHLHRMLDELERRGLLENTLVVATADNGMPFPRVKGQEYEMSNHLPLAIRWPRGVREPGRAIEDYVSFIDLAPTFLEVAGVSPQASGLKPMTGRSLTDIFAAESGGWINPQRDHVLIGKERHDVGRPNDGGYPIRGILKRDFLYLQNFETERWPAGDPITGYLNCDGGPTKTSVLATRGDSALHFFWRSCFGKRPAEELYHVVDDPYCMRNLADRPRMRDLKQRMREQLHAELKERADPRILGRGEVFDAYPYSDPRTAHFYERYTQGEEMKAGWVSPSDFDRREP